MIKFFCYQCGGQIGCPNSQAGGTALCPKCHANNKVPLSGSDATGGMVTGEPAIEALATLAGAPAVSGPVARLRQKQAAGRRSMLLMVVVLVLLAAGVCVGLSFLVSGSGPENQAKKAAPAAPVARAPVPKPPERQPAEPSPPTPGETFGTLVVTPGAQPADGGQNPTFFGVGRNGEVQKPAPAQTPSTPSNPGQMTGATVPNLPTVSGFTGRVVTIGTPTTPDNRKLAEEQLDIASKAQNEVQRVAAVRRALEYDPNDLEANILMANLLIARKDINGAVDQVEKIKQIARANPPANTADQQRLAALLKDLTQLREQAVKWAAVCDGFVPRYMAVCDQAVDAKLPSVTTSLARASMLKPQDEGLARRAKVAAETRLLPEPADPPDPAVAAAFRNQANGRMDSGDFVEAVKLLTAAHALSPDDVAIACDLATAAGKAGQQAVGAAALLDVRAKAAEQSGTPAGQTIIRRIDTMMEQLDPGIHQLALLDRELVAAATPLAAQAAEAGDNRAADEIRGVIAAVGMSDSSSGTTAGRTSKPSSGPVSLAGKVNFNSKAIDIRQSNCEVQRSRDSLLIEAESKTDPNGQESTTANALVRLGELTFKGDWKISWKLQISEEEGEGNVYISCLPITEKVNGNGLSLQNSRHYKRWYIHGAGVLQSNGYEFTQSSQDEQKAAYREGGDYVVSFQCTAGVLTAYVDATKILEVRMNALQLEKAAETPVELMIKQNVRKKTSIRLALDHLLIETK